MLRATAVLALAEIACGAGASSTSTPAAYVVVLPSPEDAPPPVPAAPPPPEVRVVASPEIPAWQAPRGHGDPCATWTSEKSLFECDAANEDVSDAGPKTKTKAP